MENEYQTKEVIINEYGIKGIYEYKRHDFCEEIKKKSRMELIGLLSLLLMRLSQSLLWLKE